MRIAWWSMVMGGLIGALLWTGPVGAQQPPGGLPACQASLQRCQADLAACHTELASCQVFPGDGVQGPPLLYRDNGDGTFTDLNTWLMWQKEFPTPAGYTWTNTPGGTALNGTIVTGLFEVINNRCEAATSVGCTSNAQCTGMGGTGKCGLAGYRDWRLPNIRELQSLVDYSRADSVSNVPGLNTPAYLWSGTTDASDATRAWFVDFQNGRVIVSTKNVALSVRTVRGPD
jgi:hypothetical protein